MGEFIGFVVIIAAVMVIINAVTKSKSRNKRKVDLKKEPPQALSTIDHPEFQEIEKKLQNALQVFDPSILKGRFEEGQQSKIEGDFEWRFFELKRFFFMNALLKEVPMFSQQVDDIWHNMILFTKEYEQFGRMFLEMPLHHTPNIKKEPDPGLRAFYDWIYSELFTIYPQTTYYYGRFFRYPVKPDVVNEFKTKPVGFLKEKYFKTGSLYEEAIHHLIQKMKKSVEQIDHMDINNLKEERERAYTNDDMNLLLPVALYASFFLYESYEDKVWGVGAAASSSSFFSGCGSSGGGSDSHHHGHHCSSNNCSGSSCSSCSCCSSCGSGCGSS